MAASLRECAAFSSFMATFSFTVVVLSGWRINASLPLPPGFISLLSHLNPTPTTQHVDIMTSYCIVIE